ncbi:aldo/keto reductase [Erythrobacter colymbi]|uniref:aldo/keto reductase n=1 Tax=Erythrobacter colymbi TaxID=1161202 RepID=UPI0023E42825|nr:aldo/keto reductase [Erythrobacter colymbi]
MTIPLLCTAAGSAIPALGFGTYGMDGQALARVLPPALEMGLRHIDTAQIYRNEAAVGDLVRASGLRRSDVFLTTKVWPANYGKRFDTSLDESLRHLGTDHVDLLLLHWPEGSDVPLADQVGALARAQDAGKARMIGVSNFDSARLAAAASLSDRPLATNQVEFHPFLDQRRIHAATRNAGMLLTAYCPLAVGRVFSEPLLAEIARETGRSIVQIVLRWVLEHEKMAALTRTSRADRLEQYRGLFNFTLGRDHMAAIATLGVRHERIVNPAGLTPIWDVPGPPQ